MINKISKRKTFNIQNNKGMTLVEVIVSMVIATIVVGITGGLIVSSTSFFNNAASRAEDERVASTVLSFVMSELRFATEINVDSISSTPPEPIAGRGLIYTMDESRRITSKGMLGFKRPMDKDTARNVYGESFYNGRRVGLRMQVLDVVQPKVVKIFVDVYDKDGKKVYEDSGTLEIPNVPYNNRPTELSNGEPTNSVLFDFAALPEKTPTEPINP